MKAARILAAALGHPASTANLSDTGWTALIACARAESLAGTLAHRLEGESKPPGVEAILADARRSAAQGRTQALWEAEMARRALAPLRLPVILLKGTAYAAAGLDAAQGRAIGDLDILVPRKVIPEVEAALLDAGWEWAKDGDYDQLYYRRWMHELPPLIHRIRDRMIDVHHTILPLTARITPDAGALIRDSVELQNGLRVLCPADMVIHSAAHLFADGDLSGGLRNLWDIERLVREFSGRPGFREELAERAELHGLRRPVSRALRLAERIFQSRHLRRDDGLGKLTDPLYARRLLARDGWGRGTGQALRFAFYVRSHWLRMPPLQLARHLLIKARSA